MAQDWAKMGPRSGKDDVKIGEEEAQSRTVEGDDREGLAARRNARTSWDNSRKPRKSIRHASRLGKPKVGGSRSAQTAKPR